MSRHAPAALHITRRPAAVYGPRHRRQAERLEEVRRALRNVPNLQVLEATGDFGRGMVGVIRHKPDCVLLGWDGEFATKDVCDMIGRLGGRLKVVIVAASAAELALARVGAAHACAFLSTGGLAQHLPGVLVGQGQAA